VDATDTIAIERSKYPGDDRPVFIGQAPSRHGDPTKPLTGSPGRKLAALAAMTSMEFYLSTVRTNVLPRYVGASGGGDAFPMADARSRAVEMVAELDGRVVVFVGRSVAEAFGCGEEWFDWEEGRFSVGDLTVKYRRAVMPHPSGRNRFWNDSRNVQEARRFMSELMMRRSSIPRLRMLRERARAINERQLGRRASNNSLRGVMSGSGAGSLPKHLEGADTRGAR
jgi:uracil-DNA glycosylase